MFSNLVPGSLFRLVMLDQCFATISTFTSTMLDQCFTTISTFTSTMLDQCFATISTFTSTMLDQCFTTISTFTSNNVGSLFCQYLNIYFQQCWISVLPLSQHSLLTMLDVGSNFVRLLDQGLIFEVGGEIQNITRDLSCCSEVNMLVLYQSSREYTSKYMYKGKISTPNL